MTKREHPCLPNAAQWLAQVGLQSAGNPMVVQLARALAHHTSLDHETALAALTRRRRGQSVGYTHQLPTAL